MITYSRTLQNHNRGSDFNRLRLMLKWSKKNKKGIRTRFNKFRGLLTDYLRNPNRLRVNNNTRFHIF